MDQSSNDLAGPSIVTLPPELVLLILQNLNVEALYRCRQVSSYLRDCCHDWNLWSYQACHDFKCPTNLFIQTQLAHPWHRYQQIQSYYHQREDSLIFAARTGNLGLARFLRETVSQKTIEFQCYTIYQAFEEANNNNHVAIIQELISDMVKLPNLIPRRYGWKSGISMSLDTALSCAISLDRTAIIAAIIQGGSQHNWVPTIWELDMALDDAAERGNVEMVRVLMENGAKQFNTAF